MGDDWQGNYDILKDYCEIEYLSRTEDISSSQLKKSLTSFLSTSKEDILGFYLKL